MKQFKNKVLYIESNEMLEEVRELIEKQGFELGEIYTFSEPYFNYLYHLVGRSFELSFKWNEESEITLEEFKELLKQ